MDSHVTSTTVQGAIRPQDALSAMGSVNAPALTVAVPDPLQLVRDRIQSQSVSAQPARPADVPQPRRLAAFR